MARRSREGLTRQRRAVLAAIARREWLLQMLALGAASCGRGVDRAYSRGNTLIAAVDGYANDRPLTPDEYAEYLVYLPLVRIDEHGDRQPCLATAWEHSADYMEWTYRLRPGVRWHDGTPVTVDDVKFTIDMHGRPNSPVYGRLRLDAECTVHDDSTFTVRGIGWTKGFGEDAVMSILPKHLVQDLDYQHFYEWDFWLRPIGDGPYRYLRYQPGTMVELEANPDYYQGKPTIERVVLKFTRGASLTELLSGNVDAILPNDSAQRLTIANDARFQTYWTLANGGSDSFMVIVWQNEHPLFLDREVRRALSLALNRRELLQVLNLPVELSLVDGWYTPRQARRGEGSEPRYDVAEAKRLLDEAGWRQRSRDGLRERDGQEFRFTALVSTQAAWAASCVDAAVFVQDRLRDLGVRMDLLPLEAGVLKTRIKAKEFEAAVCSQRFVAITPESFFGEQSPVGYRNPQLTKLLDVLPATADPDARDQAHREMSDLLRRDQPITFLLRGVGGQVVHRRVKGLSAPWRANPLDFAEDLWLDNRA